MFCKHLIFDEALVSDLLMKLAIVVACGLSLGSIISVPRGIEYVKLVFSDVHGHIPQHPLDLSKTQ